MNSPPIQSLDFDTSYWSYLDGLLTNNRQKCRLIFGQAFRWCGCERVERLPGVSCLMTLTALEAWMKDSGKHV